MQGTFINFFIFVIIFEISNSSDSKSNNKSNTTFIKPDYADSCFKVQQQQDKLEHFL